MRLSIYEITIKNKQGKKKIWADFLSRLPVSNNEVNTNEDYFDLVIAWLWSWRKRKKQLLTVKYK